MYVICISGNCEYGLTKGKVYKCLDKSKGIFMPIYKIANDYGVIRYYYEDSFRPVKSNDINKLLHKGL